MNKYIMKKEIITANLTIMKIYLDILLLNQMKIIYLDINFMEYNKVLAMLNKKL